MLDWTSALYLGMRHAHRTLRPWRQLTTGRPAALDHGSSATAVAAQLARLQGCDRSLLAPSTLHAFWDVFGMIDRRQTAIYVDAGVYPIARWGVERAAAQGVHTRRFPHYTVAALREAIGEDRLGRAPLVVADGVCPGCGRVAPLAAYRDIVRAHGGQLVIDDTQALGILGDGPSATNAYGSGGGGSLRWSGAHDPRIVVIASLAKAFGVPITVLAGSADWVQHVEEHSETRVHCSPPSIASFRAAAQALAINHLRGELLRARLLHRVRYFRQALAAAGLRATGGIFPVQTIDCDGMDAAWLYEHLRRRGIHTILHRARGDGGGRLSLIITALHRRDAIDQTVEALAQLAASAVQRQLWR
ncbi:MAG TPA: aminotransferase class I/II-fold pyridoxal phosphate-dependent enzyme [Herpetosiphonaceae bacterium]